ncbi:TolC family protein [Thermostilla marina]
MNEAGTRIMGEGRLSARGASRAASLFHRVFFLALVLAGGLPIITGCHRSFYRQQADDEVACLVETTATDPRWKIDEFSINPAPESRMYDPFCPDEEPRPCDDPASHRYMECVDGKKGSKHWDDWGTTPEVENPNWRAFLPVNEKGVVVLDRNSAVQLALIHSRDYQQRLENLYLAALNVAAERYRFDIRYFGNHSTFFTADGPDRAGGASSLLVVDNGLSARKLFATGGELLVGFANSMVWEFSGTHSYVSSSLIDFSIVQPLLRAGGRAVVLENLTQAQRALLANIRQMERYRKGFYLQIVSGTSAGSGPGGGNVTIGSLTPSTGAGRSGVLGLLQDQVRIRNQEQNVAGLQDSYEQLLAAHEADRIDRFQVDLALQSLYNAQSQLLQLRNNYQSSLDSFKITLGLPPDVNVEISDPILEMFDLIDPQLMATQQQATRLARALRDPEKPLPDDWQAQLAEICTRTREHAEQVAGDISRLADALPERRESLQRLYEHTELGPEGTDKVRQALADLDERFEKIQAAYAKLMGTGGDLPAPQNQSPFSEEKPTLTETLAAIEQFLADPQTAVDARRKQLEAAIEGAKQEIDKANAEIEAARQKLTEAAVDEDITEYQEQLSNARGNARVWQERLEAFQEKLAALDTHGTDDTALELLEPLLMEISDLTLIQARAKLDRVVLTPVEITPEEAIEIARTHRLDWMNARAALVDQWRQIRIAANDLRSSLDVTFSGDMGTIGDNPVAFRGTTGRMRIGFEFDAPFDRLLERNAYRRALINYQRARRDYYAFEDRVYQGIRDILRNIESGRLDFELRREAVAVAIAQVDLARERLRQPPRAGATSQFGATTARDLVQALSGLLNAQNAFLGNWVNYEVQRMLLDYEMGTMQLDDQGLWIDPGPITAETVSTATGETELPVPTIEEILELQPGVVPEESPERAPAPEGPVPAAVPEFPEADAQSEPQAVVVSDVQPADENGAGQPRPTGEGLFRDERPQPLKRLFENLRGPSREPRSAFVPLSPLG